MKNNFLKNKIKNVLRRLKSPQNNPKQVPQVDIEGEYQVLREENKGEEEYQKSRQKAREQVLREAGGQDISAI